MTDTAVPEPRETPDLVGHAASEATLKAGLDSGRLAHAWLLSGPKGIGKATLAYRFARYVLAQGAEAPATAPEPAGAGLFGDDDLPAAPEAAGSGDGEGLWLDPEHPTFRRVAAGGHADLKAITRTPGQSGKLRGEIVVDDVRGIGHFLSLTAAEGGWRVVIVDSADEMNRNAANAVLKVLEEPPKRALLLLVSHNPGRLLPTIRSRCRRLVMEPLDAETLAGLLARHLPETSEADRTRLAAAAEGSVGRALRLADAGGIPLIDEVDALFDALPDLDVAGLHAFAARIGRSGQEEAFEAAIELYRHRLTRAILAKATGEGAAADLALAAKADLGTWLGLRDDGEAWLRRLEVSNLDRRQVTLSLFLALQAACQG